VIRRGTQTLLGSPSAAADNKTNSSGVPLVQCLLDEDRGAEALKLAQKLIEEDASLAGRYYVLGLCLDRVGRHEEALAAYSQELAKHPGNREAQDRSQALTEALTPPTPEVIPMTKRSWHTSLPREVLLRLQRSSHNYMYRGVSMLKNAFDFALYPLLIWKLKPRTIIEVGSKAGGSAVWFGDLLTSFGIEGQVYSLDIVKVDVLQHPRVTFLEADGRALDRALGPELLGRLPRPWLVVEDADHAYQTSSAVLNFFHPWLVLGDYIVIEDGIISDLTEDTTCSSGPHCALKEFLKRHAHEYEIDSDYCDFFGYNVTWCTNGFLRKLTSPECSAPLLEQPRSERPTGLDLCSRNHKPRLLNLGCGAHFHPDWLNLDLVPSGPNVQRHDLRKPLPFGAGEFSAVYHSHVLEHMRHSEALPFLRECHRVLATGGVLRVAVPDLETIGRLYLRCLEGALAGEPEASERYDWIVLELLDQMVREESGGEMLRYWERDPMPAEEFVIERVGEEVRRWRRSGSPRSEFRGQRSENRSQTPEFRALGETHKWMYDRYSLGRLLREAGFGQVRVCAGSESGIPNFTVYRLDVTENGTSRKPDSLFMEAVKG
jgi:cephalosporin hydroxylase/predicted SAM-dependent methyltransferase